MQPQHGQAFANGMEFFATYGGCTAAGAAGMATLSVIQEEQFQARAQRVGRYLTAELDRLKEVCASRQQGRPILVPFSSNNPLCCTPASSVTQMTRLSLWHDTCLCRGLPM